MITKFIVRDNIDNGHIYGEPTGPWAAPFDRTAAGHDTLEKAMNLVKWIVTRYPEYRDRLYVTETEYASEERQRQDFHIQSYIRWASWMDGYNAI